MKKTIQISLLFSLLTITSCNNSKQEAATADTATPAYEALRQISWITGSWQGSTSEGLFGEQWVQQNDSTFSGKGYFMVGKDTVSIEALRLVQNGKMLFYEPTVNNQNGGQPIRFGMTSFNPNTVVFENPAHDFPQKITYTKITADSIVAEISGKIKEQQRSQVFAMHRIK